MVFDHVLDIEPDLYFFLLISSGTKEDNTLEIESLALLLI